MSINPTIMHQQAKSVAERQKLERMLAVAKAKGFNMEVKKDGTVTFKMSK